MADSRELTQLIVEAEDIARAAEQRATTAHYLLAIFTVPCPARALLLERGIDEGKILAAMKVAPREAGAFVPELLARTREIAQGTGVDADSLHLLMAMSRSKDSLAYELLSLLGVPLAALRNTILSWYTGGRIPRQYLQADRDEPAARRPQRVLAAARAPDLKQRVRMTKGPAGIPSLGAAVAPQDRLAEPPAAPSGEEREGPEVLPPQAPPVSPPVDEPVARGDAGGDWLADEGPRLEPPAAREEVPIGADPAAGAAEERPASGGWPLPPASRFRLEASLFPTLTAFGRNLSLLAAEGRLDPLIGRGEEVDRVVDILGKRRGNNPVLVGEPGVGKTALVEGIAHRLCALGSDRIIVEIDMASLVAGTALRGAFSERLEALKEEVRHAAGRVVVFIDEIHTVVGAGVAGDGPQDAANELKAALARGEFPCIGATTYEEYRKHLESDPALERRFTVVRIDEPTVEEAIGILEGLAPRYEAHHKVRLEEEALEAAATLSARFIHDRQLPDKAIQAIDLACSRSRRRGRAQVDRRAVAEVIAELAGLPVERLLQSDAERLLRLEEELGQRVIGHDEVIAKVARTIRRNYAGFASRRPLGSFLFLGPTGVGKTELAKALAEVLFGSEKALIRIDMSELSEATGVSRLLGAPPGYVGYGEGGQLTEAVRRRPASVVLLDEIEKAHRDVWMLLLQVLDEGHLTDAKGRRVDFGQCVVVLTSNLGAEAFSAGSAPVGFAAPGSVAAPAQRALEEARRLLPPELWNRLDERCLLAPLEREEVAAIARLLLSASARRLQAERGISIDFDDSVIDHLLRCGGYDPALGARPMRQAIQRHVEGPVAEAILRGELAAGSAVKARIEADRLAFR